MPEIQDHVISIAETPGGELYIGGEKIHKLVSIDRDTIGLLTYFIDAISKDVQINGISLNLTTKVLSIDFTRNSNNGTDEVTTSFIHVKVPKTLLGDIFQVTSDKYNKTSAAADKVVESFQINENRKVLNVGDTIIKIKLKSNVIGDKILIKGKASSLVQVPVRNITIYR